MIKKNCNKYYDINWKQVLKDNNRYNNRVNKLTDNYKINFVINELSKLKNEYHIKNQIMDHYYKVNLIQLNNNLIIPVNPVSNLLKYKLIDFYELDIDTIPSYEKTIEYYKYINNNTNIKYYPVYKLLDINKRNIVNIVLNTGSIIPVKYSPIKKNNILLKDSVHFYDVNKHIRDNVQFPDERIKLINKIEFENETYERLRLMSAKYLNKYTDKKDEIINIIKKDIKVDKKREEVSNILYSFIKKMVHIDTGTINLENYKPSNIRKICYDNKVCTDINCIFIKNKCKLRVMKNNLVTNRDNITIYINNISEELIRNPLIGNDIFNNKVPIEISLKNLKKHPYEILLNKPDMFNDIDKYYIKKDKYHKNNKSNIDYVYEYVNKEYNFNKKKYKLITNSPLKYEDEELSSLWKKILESDYHKFKYRHFDTLTFKETMQKIFNIDPSNNIKNNFDKIDYNILILENRVTKDNKKGFTLIDNGKDRYIILYHYKKDAKYIYAPVVMGKDKFIFDELPNKLNHYVQEKKKLKIKIKKK